ncbi:MAG: DUF2273 domain-containing protein [Peptococcaceae bacterium]|nr:DUF2273 domain-containing protein [Peptococcaceae bacterium]
MSTQNDTPWWDPDIQQPAVEDTTPTAAAEAPSGSMADHGSSPRRLTTLDLIRDWVQDNIHTTIYMLIGFIIACCILGFGFWRTLLVVFCVGAGYFIGGWRDGNPRLRERFQRFYTRWIQDNPFMNDKH